MYSLSYGTNSRIELDVETDAVVTVCDAPCGQALADVRAGVQAALDAPLEFPPLKQAALPGDKVVLALESDVPQAAIIAGGAIAALLAAGVQAEDITVLTVAGGSAPDAVLGELPSATRTAITCLAHDPRDRERMSYLAATADSQPIYIHRAIHDADLVVSVGSLRLQHTLGYHGVHSGVFPTFSDASTLARFRSPKAASVVEQERLDKQADEVGWLLGARFTIQVIPGANGDVLHVLAGEPQAVHKAGMKLCQAAWSFEVPGRVELVVAAIGGDAIQQTWESVARALAAAARVLDENGDVVICSHLEQRPGPAMERMIGADDLYVALREITREKPVDSLWAAQLGQALERGRVYLLSGLADERVEELGIYPLDADSVSRVTSRYGSCLLLANAQYAQAWPTGDLPRKRTSARKSRS